LPMWTINRVALLGTFAILTLIPQFALAADPYAVIVEHGVAVTIRDGTVLRADIYRLVAPGRYPVLLERTPYDKHSDGGVDFGHKAGARGYVVINQDVRGRYTSDGEWYPFLHESNDGYDTVEWAPALPYSDGRVGMYEGSYVGATQMLAGLHIRRISREYVRS
jgi:putative CocE/NonD family hydrolase